MSPRLFAYRFVRVLLWIFVTLITLLVLLWAWTNWSGKRRWAATQSMLHKEGETLDFLALAPETPPDAQNLLAIEPLHGIAAVVEQNPDKGEPGAKRKALEALKLPTDKNTTPPSDGVAFGRATDIQDWLRYWRDSKWIDLPAAPTPDAGAALTAMDAKFPVLKQLADTALDRPAAMFTPGMRERAQSGMLFAMHVPHYAVAQNLGRALSLRARLALAVDDSPEAVRSITAITRLTHASREEGLLLGFLVGSNLDLHAMEAVWHGLRDHAFSEDDLRRLKGLFAIDETTKPYLRAMRAEMAAGVDALNHMQATATGDEAMVAMLGHGADRMVRLLPSGLFDHWKSSLVETELRHLIQPLHKGLIQGLHAGDLAQAEAKQNSNLLLHPDRFMDNRIMPAISALGMHALLIETRRRQAFMALALEQFFLKQGKFPGKLEELTQEFLPAGVPLDPCDGKPLRYVLPAPGSYVLWSVAVDENDDVGKVTVGTEGHTKLRQRDYSGDWAWQYFPVPAAAAQ